MTQDQSLKLMRSPKEFFKDEISHSLTQMNVNIDPSTKSYLVDLLDRQVGYEESRRSDLVQGWTDRPLALQLMEAEHAPASMRLSLFRRVGDTTLIVCGFFREFFANRSFNRSYYLELGMTSYLQASKELGQRVDVLNDIYEKLANHLNSLADALAEFSDRMQTENYRNLSAVYQRWQVTKSERLLEVLETHGVKPLHR